MTKRVFFGGVALVMAAFAFLLTDHFCWEPGVTAASVCRIRPGMTRQEAEAILGGPDDMRKWLDSHFHPLTAWKGLVTSEYQISPEEQLEPLEVGELDPTSLHSPNCEPDHQTWSGTQGTATVLFGRDGRVISATFEPKSQAGVLARLLAWFGW